MDLARSSYKPIPQFPTDELGPRPPLSESSPSLSFCEKEDRSQTRATRWLSGHPLLYHILALVVYSIIFAATILSLHRARSPHGFPALIYSPAREALLYEARVFEMKRDPKNMGPYFGPPSRELDLAWHTMLQNQNIRISRAELAHFSGREEQAVEYPDGLGYMAQLRVYHDLHCLKRIHHTMWPDYYYPNMSELEREDLKFHNDHCLSSLLSTLTCHPDISLITMRWGHTQPIPLGNFSAAHECANWDALDDWSAGRRVDVLRPGWLRHPVLGASFPEGRGVRTGVGHDG